MDTSGPSTSGAGSGPSNRISLSLVTDYGPGASTCGYCGSKQDVNWSHGMQAEFMTVETYQALLDRGWRRSGRWIYKPLHSRTCCQLITIRLDVEKFQMSKDQRQVQRKWEAHLAGAPLKQKYQQHPTFWSPNTTAGGEEDDQLQGGSPKRMREEEEFEFDHGEGFGKELQGGGKRQRSYHNLAAMDEKGKDSEQQDGGSDNDDISKLNRAASPTTELSEQLQVAYVGTAKYPSFSKESEPWSANGNGFSNHHHQHPSLPPSAAATAAPLSSPQKQSSVDEDLSLNLSKELQAALERCIEAGRLPDLNYPLPKVSPLSAHQRKKLPSDVAYTSPAPLAVTGVANRIENCADDEEEEEEGAPVQPLSLESTAKLLLDQMQLPHGIAGAEIANGHINFKIQGNSIVAGGGGHGGGAITSIEIKGKQVVKEQGHRCGSTSSNTDKPTTAATTTATIPRSPPRHFELIMLPSSDERLSAVEFELYKKYQVMHHGDSPSSVSKSSFIRFLCDSPLVHAAASSYPPGGAPPCGFGSFHQQYWLDGRLIAVGVIDVLPRALSSKYLFWDPDYSSLSLGKLASIQEIAWIKEAHASCPSLKYYYLGYYLHTCHRMRYKAEFGPSDLLCPVQQCWVPIERITAALDQGHRAPALADVPGALAGLTEEYLVNSEANPLLPPQMPSAEEVKNVKLFVRSAGEGGQRRGQIVTFGVLKGLGVLSDGLIAHLQHRLQEWVMMVGPAWKNIAYKLE